MKAKYEDLREEVNDEEKYWKKYKDAFVGIAEVLCGRSTVMGENKNKSRKVKSEKKEAWNVSEIMKVNTSQHEGRLPHLYGDKKR